MKKNNTNKDYKNKYDNEKEKPVQKPQLRAVIEGYDPLSDPEIKKILETLNKEKK